MDYPLVGTAVLYFCLSWLMAYIIRRLPVYCQTSWSLISTWGILWATVGETLLRWGQCYTSYQFMTDLAIIFLAAFPGMLYLDFMQKKERITFWEKNGLPHELVHKRIFPFHSSNFVYLDHAYLSEREK